MRAPLAAVLALFVGAAAAQDESQADSNGLRAEKAQVPAYGEVGPADGEEAWYGQEGQSWLREGQPWYGQDSFGPMAPQDYDISDGQFYQPQEQQSYWAQLPQDQVNGFSGEEWYSPDQDGGQMYVPDLNGQPYLSDQNGQPYIPDQNGQTFFPELNGEPYMPEMSEESQESDTGVLAGPMGGVDSYSNGWYTPMASVAPQMTADWNGGVEHPNQWYNVDPYGPVPSYDQNPCDYMYQYYYDDCNSGSYLDDNNNNNFVPKCEESVCLQSCQSHFGYNEGVCFNNECYCRNQGMDWTHQNQKDWPSKYPECAVSDVHKQSPVDIEPKFISDLSRELFYNQLYGSNMSFIAINTGHGLRHYVQASQLPAVQVMENLDLHHVEGDQHQIEMGTYVLAFIDYHWNISEHYVLGKHGDLEAQMHHFELSYGTYEEAAEVPGAVLSIALLFKIDPTESDLDDRLFPDSIMKPDKAGEVVEGVSFIDLRAEKASKKYGLYRGTLTYPPCTRNVNWLVSAEMHPIRADQIERLQQMQDPLGRPIVNNSRRLKGQVGA